MKKTQLINRFALAIFFTAIWTSSCGDKIEDNIIVQESQDNFKKGAAKFLLDDNSGCCETELECWHVDAIADGVTCRKNSDCASGQICDTKMSGPGYSGICSCSADTDCNDGVCVKDTNRCGPSWCNGYYICSCFSGCVWWNPDSLTRTPADDAAALGRTCCEGGYPEGNLLNRFFSVDPTCGYGTTIEEGCKSDADCDDLNECTKNTCNLSTGICSTLVMVGHECEADGLGCTVDRCNAQAQCVYSAQRCPPDTYGDKSLLNTCTIDCVEDLFDSTANGQHWECYVNVDIPLDNHIKDVTGSCSYWTCDTSSSIHIPVKITQAVSDASCGDLNDECNTYACDPENTLRGNCSAVNMKLLSPCTSSEPFNLCMEAECIDSGTGVAVCQDYPAPPPVENNDPCNELACEISTGLWKYIPNESAIAAITSCDDGDLCTTNDVCITGGFCLGTPVECLDSQCTEYGCDSSSGECVVTTHYSQESSCDLGDSLWCTYGLCDGLGGCSAYSVECSGVAPECNTMSCKNSISACENTVDMSQLGQECSIVLTAPNCEATCEKVVHSNSDLAAAGMFAGQCRENRAINDTCDIAWDMGDFLLADSSGTTIGEFGSTACATNSHYSIGINCTDGDSSLGRFSKDVVYSFTYEASGTGSSRIRYLVKVEPEPDFDAAVYVSSECSVTGGLSPVASNSCVKNSSMGIHEDECMSPYDCSPVDGTYAGTMAQALVYEDSAAAAGEMVTVYIYVDGLGNRNPMGDSGEFYVSVSKEEGCPDPASWYGGRINYVIEPGLNDLPVPINGVDFQGVVPSPSMQSGTKGNVHAVLLKGDTRTAVNAYSGEPGDALYAWAGNDEMWELEVLEDGVNFGVSMCDYGGQVNQDGPDAYNPMVALFNCYGDRVDFADGSKECGAQVPHLNPTVPVYADEGPYYLLVDGRFETGVTGNLTGGAYELSVFYERQQLLVGCEPDNAAPKYSIVLGKTDYRLTEPFYYYPSSCVTADATGWERNYMRVNAGDIHPVGTSAQCCDWNGGKRKPNECTNTAPCFPLYVIYDVWYEDSNTGEICIDSGYIMQYDRHGNNLSEYIPTIVPFEGCDKLIRVDLAYSPTTELLEAEYNWCHNHCSHTRELFIRARNNNGN